MYNIEEKLSSNHELTFGGPYHFEIDKSATLVSENIFVMRDLKTFMFLILQRSV